MDKGQEHVSNARKFNCFLQVNISMVFLFHVSYHQEKVIGLCAYINRCKHSGHQFLQDTRFKQYQQDKSVTPNLITGFKKSTVGWPKDRKFYGHGVSILGVRRYSSIEVRQANSDISIFAVNGLNGQNQMGISEQRHTSLYKLITDRDLLHKSYLNLKSRSRSMTPGTDGQILDGINLQYLDLDKLIKSLKDESFEFTSVKRVYIPKANGKLRPLGIPNIKDRLVQEAMRIILNDIYETSFSNLSHGFRPGRSCHTALKEVSK
jgi:hypothetical protein